jgi:DNA-binding NarL/FixJ family response regulator
MLYHIAIAEDLPRLARMLQENVELSPDFKVVHIAMNGRAMIDWLETCPNKPDLILMDINMPEMNGIEATQAVKDHFPQIKVVMATVFEDENHIFDAILAGADGYLLKDETPEDFHRNLHEALEGGAPMSPAIARKSLQMMRRGAPQPAAAMEHNLTPREVEILEQLSRGLSYQQVADNLFVSTGTVRTHIEHVYRKLQVNNKTAAVEQARRKGII